MLGLMTFRCHRSARACGARVAASLGPRQYPTGSSDAIACQGRGEDRNGASMPSNAVPLPAPTAGRSRTTRPRFTAHGVGACLVNRGLATLTHEKVLA
jgi:hypothetical protein